MSEPSSAFASASAPRERTYPRATHWLLASRAFSPAIAWLLGLFAWHHALSSRWWAISAGLWGLLVLTSFIAWGATVTRVLSRRLGWGFDGATGMALTLAVLGALSCLRLTSVTLVVAWTAAGPFVLSFVRWHQTKQAGDIAPISFRLPSSIASLVRTTFLKPRPVSFLVGLAVLYSMAALQYVESTTNAHFNQWDDDEAYRLFAREFLDTGTLYDPFSYRRAASYGGQSLLHAIVLALSDRERLHMLDDGICVLLLLGIITCFRSSGRWGSRGPILAGGFLLLTLHFTPHNTASEFSGVLFFLALYTLFDDPRFGEASIQSNAILTGLLASAACTLRQNYLMAVILFVALMHLDLFIFPAKRPRREWLAQSAAVLGVTIGCLLPWILMAYRAEDTFFYPVFKGHVRPDFGVVGTVTWAELLKWTLMNLFALKPFRASLLMFAAAFVLPVCRRTRAVHVFLLTNSISFLLMIYFFQAVDDSDSIARYYFAFTFAFAIAITLRSLGEAATRRRAGEFAFAGVLVMIAIALQFIGTKDEVLQRYMERINALEDVVKNRRSALGESRGGVSRAIAEGELARLSDTYRQLQESVPAGEPILVVLDHTYLLDGKRNPIYLYDHPGATGPEGGPPCFEGADAFAQYLHKVGVHYIAYQWGDSSPEYSTPHWKSQLAKVESANGRGGFYKNQARFELDFANSIASLAASRRILFEEREIKVLDLESQSAQ